MDWSLLVVLVLGVGGFLAFRKLRRKPPAAPFCTACQVDMEPVADMLDPSDPMMRFPLGMSDPTLFGHTRVFIYECPRCLKRQRLRA
jgi:hypothetical protein